jgi:hypothetical protein
VWIEQLKYYRKGLTNEYPHVKPYRCWTCSTKWYAILKLLQKCEASTKFTSRTAHFCIITFCFLILTSVIEEKMVYDKYLSQPTKSEYSLYNFKKRSTIKYWQLWYRVYDFHNHGKGQYIVIYLASTGNLQPQTANDSFSWLTNSWHAAFLLWRESWNMKFCDVNQLNKKKEEIISL